MLLQPLMLGTVLLSPIVRHLSTLKKCHTFVYEINKRIKGIVTMRKSKINILDKEMHPSLTHC